MSEGEAGVNRVGVAGGGANKRGSFLSASSLEFTRGSGKREREGGRRASFGNSTTQYHSLADSLGGQSQLPRKRTSSLEIPVLPMNILKSNPITQSPINC